MKFESLIEQITNRYEYIAAIHVGHHNLSHPNTYLRINVFTGEAESLEEYLDIVPSGKVEVETVDGRTLTLPVSVIATYNGPDGRQRTSGTTIYMADNVIRGVPRDIETGISMFRKKISGMCPHCGARPESLVDHYRNNRDCAKAEKGLD
jgi:hypothetical protein